MKLDKADEIMARLRRFEALERKATDEIGWIALAYSCSREVATRMIETARHLSSRNNPPSI